MSLLNNLTNWLNCVGFFIWCTFQVYSFAANIVFWRQPIRSEYCWCSPGNINSASFSLVDEYTGDAACFYCWSHDLLSANDGSAFLMPA